MNAPSPAPAYLDPLDRLTRRIRWKRWLARVNRLAWMLAVVFALLFLADLAIGLRTLSLRIASAGMVLFASATLVVDWFLSWRVRVDRIGVAQLIEQHYPDLSERLVTLVQLESEDRRSDLAPLLEAETAQRLRSVDPRIACPMAREGYFSLATAVLLLGIGVTLILAPGVRAFASRLAFAHVTPLVPFRIDVADGQVYALRGHACTINARIHPLDPDAEMPTACELVCEDVSGTVTRRPMASSADGFAVQFPELHAPLRCRVEADGVASVPFAIALIDAPVLTGKATMRIVPPAYVKRDPVDATLDNATAGTVEVLRYSGLNFEIPLDRAPQSAILHVSETSLADGDAAEKRTLPTFWRDGKPLGTARGLAHRSGRFEAALELRLEHGLTTTLPLGAWLVHDDSPPRFTRPIRLESSPVPLGNDHEYRVAPDDFLRLQGDIADAEGLGAIEIEMRVNEGPVRRELLQAGKDRTALTLEGPLPLPTGLKEKDRVEFRIRVRDNRQIARSSLAGDGGQALPAEDLHPHEIVTPTDGWFALRIDRSIASFVKDQTKAQADDVIEIVTQIKKKLDQEIADLQQLQRAVHLQPALQPNQAKQGEKVHKLNLEIEEDLFRAGERLRTNPALASLAGHFFDIAGSEMQPAGDALERFLEKGRPLPEAEKELPPAAEALARAQKKLARLLDWNKMLADDRLDQWQMEKLANRQKELAARLEKLREQKDLTPAELAKEIEAIRAEQARLATETTELQQKSRLVQESLAALEQMRIQQLAEDAAKIAADQEAMRALDPEKMPAEIKERLAKLAERQADLARRVQPEGAKPADPNPAQVAALALKKPKLDEAIAAQKQQEQALRNELDKLLPGPASNPLREQVAKLAAAQGANRADLDKLGRDFAQLPEEKVKERLRELQSKQQELNAATNKLPIDPADAKLQELRERAAKSTKQAADQLAFKDALGAFDTMEKAKQELQQLADALPREVPGKNPTPIDDVTKGRIAKADAFEKEQKQLREEAEKLRADWLKSAAHGNSPLKEKLEKLAGNLLELAQKGGSPEARAMAKESMQALDEAKKAMAASDAMKAKGDANEAKKMEDEAAQKLEIAVKQLAKLAQDQAGKSMPKDGQEKTADALQQSVKEMRQAESNLPKMPKDAEASMKSAAQKLADAAMQASKQSARNLPSPPSRNPAARTPLNPGKASSLVLKNVPLDPALGKTWGELPGELKTRLLQDFRARYGEDYAEIIRQYFERLAESPKQK